MLVPDGRIFPFLVEGESSNFEKAELQLRFMRDCEWNLHADNQRSRMDVSEIMVVAPSQRAHVILCATHRPSIFPWREP
jgi:hypothetical protein